MPKGERRPQFPRWAEQERSSDLAWLVENLPLFWPVAQAGYTEFGRGAIVVDTTLQPTDGGHPFGYFTQAQITEYGGEDEQRMVTEYDPEWELVTVLLKKRERVSSYRIGVPGPASRRGRNR